MPREIKIVTFINDREGREIGEEELTRLVNDGWKIKTAGGGTGAEMVWGFVILQRTVKKKKNDDQSAEDGELVEHSFAVDEDEDDADEDEENEAKKEDEEAGD